MKQEKLPHKVNKEIKIILKEDKLFEQNFLNLTSLAVNEWLCFVSSPVKLETKERRLSRMVSDIKEGKKRPCCFGGCHTELSSSLFVEVFFFVIVRLFNSFHEHFPVVNFICQRPSE